MSAPFTLYDLPDELLTNHIIQHLDFTSRRCLTCAGKRGRDMVVATRGVIHRPGAWGASASPPLPNNLWVFYEACTRTYAFACTNSCEPILRYKMGWLTVPFVGSRQVLRAFDWMSLRVGFAFLASPRDFASVVWCYIRKDSRKHCLGLQDLLHRQVPQVNDDVVDITPALRYFEAVCGYMAKSEKDLFRIFALLFKRRLSTFEEAWDTVGRDAPDGNQDEWLTKKCIRLELNAMCHAWSYLQILCATLRERTISSSSADAEATDMTAAIRLRSFYNELPWQHYSDSDDIVENTIAWPGCTFQDVSQFYSETAQVNTAYSKCKDEMTECIFKLVAPCESKDARLLAGDRGQTVYGSEPANALLYISAAVRYYALDPCMSEYDEKFRVSIHRAVKRDLLVSTELPAHITAQMNRTMFVPLPFHFKSEFDAATANVDKYVAYFASCNGHFQFWDPALVDASINAGNIPYLSRKETILLIRRMGRRTLGLVSDADEFFPLDPERDDDDYWGHGTTLNWNLMLLDGTVVEELCKRNPVQVGWIHNTRVWR